MIVERHVSPDGVLTFVVERLDDGVILLEFEGCEWHTHPNLLDREDGATDEAATRAYIDRLLRGVAVVGVRRKGGAIVDAWIMEDPAFEADMFRDGETLEMRHWDGRPWSPATAQGGADIYAEVPGGPELVRHFGRVPSFGDGEILDLHLDRDGPSTLRVHGWVVDHGGPDGAPPLECIELVHHVRKASAGQASYTVEDARGGSALIGGVRSARVLNGMSTEEASQAGVEREKRRRFFRVDDGKANMQPPAEVAAWHELLSVPLGNETPDLPGDIVGVVAAWKLPGISDSLQSGDVRKVQDAIAAGSWADNVRADNWAGKAVASALGFDAEDPDARKRISALLSLWKKNGCLKTET